MPERAKGDKADAPQLSRLEAFRTLRKDPDYHPVMPPVDAGAHLLAHLWEVGPTMPGGMASAPVTHQELAAWQRLVGLELQSWEVRTIRRLSCDYVAESYLAQKRDRPAPSWNEDEHETRRIAARGMKETIRGIAKIW